MVRIYKSRRRKMDAGEAAVLSVIIIVFILFACAVTLALTNALGSRAANQEVMQ